VRAGVRRRRRSGAGAVQGLDRRVETALGQLDAGEHHLGLGARRLDRDDGPGRRDVAAGERDPRTERPQRRLDEGRHRLGVRQAGELDASLVHRARVLHEHPGRDRRGRDPAERVARRRRDLGRLPRTRVRPSGSFHSSSQSASDERRDDVARGFARGSANAVANFASRAARLSSPRIAETSASRPVASSSRSRGRPAREVDRRLE
jgi:hypothetical protein